MISSAFLPNAPRDLCYYTLYREVFFWERSPELFCRLGHILPCTSIALFLLWPPSLKPFLKAMAALSAFVLLLPVVAVVFFWRPATPLIDRFIFVCLRPRIGELVFLEPEECETAVVVWVQECSAGLCTLLAFLA